MMFKLDYWEQAKTEHYPGNSGKKSLSGTATSKFMPVNHNKTTRGHKEFKQSKVYTVHLLNFQILPNKFCEYQTDPFSNF